MKSYIKWIGGKSSLMNELIVLFPDKINNYFEPFVGSASVYLKFIDSTRNIIFSDEQVPNKVFLNDLNYLLINAHKCVAHRKTELLEKLELFQSEFDDSEDKESLYYEKRIQLNKVIDAESIEDEVMAATLFIFLNKTCFNGLWRVNKKGFFNASWNKDNKKNIFNVSNIEQCSYFLSKANFYSVDFEQFLGNRVNKGDFVFLDPPYIPISDSPSFVQYTSKRWSSDDTNRIISCLRRLDEIGANFMLTNSFSEESCELFDEWKIDFMDAHRLVKKIKASNNEKRQKVKEIIVRNY